MLIVLTDWKIDGQYHSYLIDLGFEGNLLNAENIAYTDGLLQLMEKLGILEYGKFFNSIYEIRIRL